MKKTTQPITLETRLHYLVIRGSSQHLIQIVASLMWRHSCLVPKSWERIWGAGTGWLDGKGRLEEMEF